MGRGIGARQVLPLLEVSSSSQPASLQLPFVGSPGMEPTAPALTLRWDAREAVISAPSPLPSRLELSVSMPRDELTPLLFNLSYALSAPVGSSGFGPVHLIWAAGYKGPGLYVAHPQSRGGFYMGSTTWELVHNLLQAASIESLF